MKGRKHLTSWVVSFNAGAGRERKFFKTKTEAEAYAGIVRDDFKEIGERASDLSHDNKIEALNAIDDLKPYGKTISEAVDYYIRHLKATERSIKIPEAIADFVAFKVQKGRSIRYIGDLKSRMSAFAKAFPNDYANEITSRMIEDWLSKLPVSNLTKNNYRRNVGVFFTYCVRQGYCSDNPIKRVEEATERYKEVSIFTPKDMALMLAEAQGDILAYLVIGGFAGLRDSETKRLEWERIKLSRGIIDLIGNKTKTAASRIVTIEPVLAHYLKGFANEKGKVCKPNFIKRLHLFRLRMNVPVEGVRPAVSWQKNGLRHSYATYYYCLYDAGLTAKQLGHNGPGELFKHYRKERVDPKDAKDWFDLHKTNGLLKGQKVETANG
jgi:integrase